MIKLLKIFNKSSTYWLKFDHIYIFFILYFNEFEDFVK